MERTLFTDNDLNELIGLALSLGARDVPGWSTAEQRLVRERPRRSPSVAAVRDAKASILRGEDPLGQAYCRVRSAEDRRAEGAVYTPPVIVEAMLAWAAGQVVPARIVDPGAGSGRFTVAAGRKFPQARLYAIEQDPVAAILCRGHIAAAGLADRATVNVEDYRDWKIPQLPAGQRTLFVGNPPYVRHHQIEPRWKEWLVSQGEALGLRPSMLAGLHVHFLVATVGKARDDDLICFITSAEWLDVNYGRMVREMFLNGAGGHRLVVIEPTAEPFPGTATTAAISCMKIGASPKSIHVKRVTSCEGLGQLEGGQRVGRDRLRDERRWSGLTRRRRTAPAGFVQLGELCRVHRGQVTGANKVWIAGRHGHGLPKSVLYSTVTRARELYEAGTELCDAGALRDVIDLPQNLDELDGGARKAAELFLAVAQARGADTGYVARNRKAWWSVGLREPAPILATYMARRPPAFVLNTAQARHLNIAHGLYPREPMDDLLLHRLVEFLSSRVLLSDGRTYAGGLTKFEPKEMERILVPSPDMLKAGVEV